MDIASLICAFLADGIVSEQETKAEKMRLEREIERLKAQIRAGEEKKTPDQRNSLVRSLLARSRCAGQFSPNLSLEKQIF